MKDLLNSTASSLGIGDVGKLADQACMFVRHLLVQYPSWYYVIGGFATIGFIAIVVMRTRSRLRFGC
jgi:hypothetical protein